MKKALIRNSIQELEHRELSFGVRQQKESVELALELLFEIRRWEIFLRVDTDGFRRYQDWI